MTDPVRPKVEAGGESAGLFEATCHQVRLATGARCAAVGIIDGVGGSGYSVKGPLEAQVLLPGLLEPIASALREQLFAKFALSKRERVVRVPRKAATSNVGDRPCAPGLLVRPPYREPSVRGIAAGG
jgi:hypothetical protein